MRLAILARLVVTLVLAAVTWCVFIILGAAIDVTTDDGSGYVDEQ